MEKPPAIVTFELKSERLWLRPCQAGDIEDLYRLWNDAEVRRYFWDGHWITRAEVQAAIAVSGCTFSRLGLGQWAIFQRGNRRFLGSAGLITEADPFFDHDIFPHGEGLLELMYALLPPCRGQGFGSEALLTIIAHASRIVDRCRIVASVDSDNPASARVLVKAGFLRERRVQSGGAQIEIFRLGPGPMSGL